MHQTLFLGPKSIDAGHDVNLHLTTKEKYKQTLTAKASVMGEGGGGNVHDAGKGRGTNTYNAKPGYVRVTSDCYARRKPQP